MAETEREPNVLLDSTVALTIGIWVTSGSMKLAMRKLGISLPKVRRILVDAGLIDTDESALYADGYTPAEIAQLMGKTKNAVQGRIPYEKGMYNRDNPTTNALRIRACRAKAARQEKLTQARYIVQIDGQNAPGLETTARREAMRMARQAAMQNIDSEICVAVCKPDSDVVDDVIYIQRG